jgi:hypothetical protein
VAQGNLIELKIQKNGLMEYSTRGISFQRWYPQNLVSISALLSAIPREVSYGMIGFSVQVGKL